MEHSRFGRKGGCFRDFREDLRRQSLEAPPRRNLHAQLHMGGMTQRLPLKKNEHMCIATEEGSTGMTGNPSWAASLFEKDIQHAWR